MQLRLHANATTTPRTRAYIQKSTASDAALARELGIHPRTVARWRARRDVADRSTRPHRLATPITAWEEALILELPHGSSPWAEGPRSLVLPLDDIVEAMRRCLNPQLSRSGVHRCLKRHGLSARLAPQQAPAVAFQTDRPAGFIHIDVKYLPPLGRRRSYAYGLPQRRLGSRSIVPPALSIWKYCPIAAPLLRPVSSRASSTPFRSRCTPS
jgi:hypothetical protein